jgi:hypothetical protein
VSVRTRRHGRIMAARMGWPRGAIATCESLERRYRGWCVSWMQAWPVKGFEREAGFYAWTAGHAPLVKSGHGGYVKRRELYGADAEAIALALSREI